MLLQHFSWDPTKIPSQQPHIYFCSTSISMFLKHFSCILQHLPITPAFPQPAFSGGNTTLTDKRLSSSQPFLKSSRQSKGRETMWKLERSQAHNTLKNPVLWFLDSTVSLNIIFIFANTMEVKEHDLSLHQGTEGPHPTKLYWTL